MPIFASYNIESGECDEKIIWEQGLEMLIRDLPGYIVLVVYSSASLNT